MQSERWSRRQFEWWKGLRCKRARQLQHNNVMEHAHSWGSRKLARDRAVETTKTNPRTRQMAYKVIADRAIAMSVSKTAQDLGDEVSGGRKSSQ
jgi:hypothetical protein